jgi:uncharacterized membrane protein
MIITEQDIEKGKGLAIISYLTIFGTIIAFFMNNEKQSNFTTFHTRQALVLWLTFFAIGLTIISNFDIEMLRLSFYIFFGVLFLYGFVNAISGKPESVPILGKFYQKIFGNLVKEW